MCVCVTFCCRQSVLTSETLSWYAGLDFFSFGNTTRSDGRPRQKPCEQKRETERPLRAAVMVNAKIAATSTEPPAP